MPLLFNTVCEHCGLELSWDAGIQEYVDNGNMTHCSANHYSYHKPVSRYRKGLQ